MTGNYNEHQVISSYSKTNRELFCHTKDPKTLFMIMNIFQVNEDTGLWNVDGNIKFNGLNLRLNKLVTLPSGLPTKPFDLVKNILGGSVKTLTGIPSMRSGKVSDKEHKLGALSIKAFTAATDDAAAPAPKRPLPKLIPPPPGIPGEVIVYEVYDILSTYYVPNPYVAMS